MRLINPATKAVCAITACTLVAGCLPFLPLVDYTPEMAGGTVTTSNCLGLHRVGYKVQGMVFSSSISRAPPGSKDDHRVLHVYMGIPAGVVAEFLEPYIAVSARLDKTATRIPIPRITTTVTDQSAFLPENRGKRWPVSPAQQVPIPVIKPGVLPPMVGEDQITMKRAHARSFVIDVPLADFPEANMHIQLPDVKINGQVEKIPVMVFKRTPRIEFIVPLNC